MVKNETVAYLMITIKNLSKEIHRLELRVYELEQKLKEMEKLDDGK